MAVELQVTEATETYGILRSTMSRLHELLAHEMENEVGMPFERYLILLMLAQADGGALRPSELADALPITPSGVTRLIDRLERDGVVERRACTSDGRGTFVALTADGTEVFRRAGRVNLRGINQHLGTNLTVSEMAELRRIMSKLAAGIHATNTETQGAGSRERVTMRRSTRPGRSARVPRSVVADQKRSTSCRPEGERP